MVTKGNIYLSPEARVYKESAQLLMNTMHLEPLSGDITLVLRFFRPEQRGDLDNRLKVLLDTLEGYVYFNDKQVTAIHAYRMDDASNPRVEIEAYND